MFYFCCCYSWFFKIQFPSFCSGSKPFSVIQQKGAILNDFIYSSVSRVINIEILHVYVLNESLLVMGRTYATFLLVKAASASLLAFES